MENKNTEALLLFPAGIRSAGNDYFSFLPAYMIPSFYPVKTASAFDRTVTSNRNLFQRLYLNAVIGLHFGIRGNDGNQFCCQAMFWPSGKRVLTNRLQLIKSTSGRILLRKPCSF